MADGAAPHTPSTATVLRHGVARGAAVIAALTLLARGAGFVRQVVFARAVGPTCVGSTYQTVNTVPNILYEIVAGGALAGLVVPLVAGAAQAGDREQVRRVAGVLLTWTVLALTPVAIVVAVAARPLTAAVLGGTRCAGAVDLGARMLVVFAPQIVLYGVGIVLTGLLQAHRRFAAPALAPLLSSLVVIGAYSWYAIAPGASGSVAGLGTGAELLLSVGTTLGVVALSLSLLPALRRAGVRVRPALRFPPGVGRRAGHLAGAGMTVLVAQQVSVAVALRLANENTGGGAVVVFTLAQTVFLLPWATLAVPLATSAFPRLAASVEDGDEASYAGTVGRVGRAVVAGTAVAAAVLFAAATPIARVLVQGVGHSGDVAALSRGIAAFAPGVVGYGLVALWSRALYARHDARTPALATAAGWLTVVVADLVLALSLPVHERVTALAIGNTIGMTVAAVLLAAGMIRRAGPGTATGLARMAMAAVGGALGGAAAGRLLASALTGGGPLLALAQGVAVALLTLLVAGAIIIGLGGQQARGLVRWRRAGG